MGYGYLVAKYCSIWQDEAMKIGEFELEEPLPDLEAPHVIAMLSPWIDAGNVGSRTLRRLQRHLGAQEFGKLVRPGTFFDFTRYRPVMHNIGGKRVLNVPNTTISYARRGKDTDLLLLQLLEPHSSSETYIDSVVELLKALGVRKYVRIGAMYDAVPHTRPLWVTGSNNGKPLEGISGVTPPRRGGGYQGPTSIMNMVSGMLEDAGVENATLMVHLPQYLEIEDDFAGAARAMEVLCNMYGLPPELADTSRGKRQYEKITEEVAENAAVNALVRRLETYYDNLAPNTTEESDSLSPQVQRFLQDMGKKLEES